MTARETHARDFALDKAGQDLAGKVSMNAEVNVHFDKIRLSSFWTRSARSSRINGRRARVRRI